MSNRRRNQISSATRSKSDPARIASSAHAGRTRPTTFAVHVDLVRLAIMPPFGTKQISKAKSGAQKAAKQAKKAAPKLPSPPKPKQVKKKAPAPVKKASNVGSQLRKQAKSVAASAGSRMGGVGYRKYEGDALWLPNTERPDWLDGSLPGMTLRAQTCSMCCGAVRGSPY